MNKRQRKIIEILITNNGQYLPSQYYASLLGVTTRTIKSDMALIGTDIKKNGAVLHSKRNHGYSLEIQNSEKINNYVLTNSIQSPGATRRVENDPDQGLYIARRLLSSEKGVSIDNLCEELSYSRSALTESIRWTNRFLESYHITIRSSARNGLTAVGEERCLRIAMVELIGTHYHKFADNMRTEEYSQWFSCDSQRRADIRHSFLKVLRESGFSLRDSNTQRVAMYLIVAYNRFNAGHLLELTRQMKQYSNHKDMLQLAGNILSALGEDYQPLLEDPNEVFFLTSYLIANLDIDCRKDDLSILAPVRASVEQCESEIQKFLTNNAIQLDDDGKRALRKILIHAVYSHLFEFDGYDKFDYGHESIYNTSPIALYFAYQVSMILKEQIGYVPNRSDAAIFGIFFLTILLNHSYPIRPLKLLLTSSFGPAFGIVTGNRLKAQFPHLIESIRPIELYEYRSLEQDHYDGILVDLHVSERGNTTVQGYNYDLPFAFMSVFHYDTDILKVHNDFLIGAYQFNDYLVSAERIRIISDFSYISQEQIIQFLSHMHGKDMKSVNRIANYINTISPIKSPVFNRTAVILVDQNLCKEESLEYYQLKKPGKWNTRRIDHIIFCSLKFDSVYRIKAMETVLRTLCFNTEEMSFFMADPVSTMQHIIRNSLRLK